MSYKLEYIWLDGYTPEPNLRSKTKIVDSEPKTADDCPGWAFDGSSTEQAEGSSSDCLLKPVKIVNDPCRKNASLVLCEVLNADGVGFILPICAAPSKTIPICGSVLSKSTR